MSKDEPVETITHLTLYAGWPNVMSAIAQLKDIVEAQAPGSDRPTPARNGNVEILKKQPTTKAPGDWFTGDVWFDVVYAGQEPSRARLNLVRFSPCARTDWHSHALGQTLHIVSGIALIGGRDGTVIEAHPGDTVHTPPGEEHWHGATPDAFMEHLALWEGRGDGSPETTWLEKVDDAEYTQPRSSTR